MKKTTSICLFTGMIFLLLVMVVYLLFTQQNTGEKEQDLAAATEEMPAETDTEKELKTTESLAVYEPYAYIIKQKDNHDPQKFLRSTRRTVTGCDVPPR